MTISSGATPGPTALSTAAMAWHSKMARVLSRRQRCEITTPFGTPVDPEVYWMRHVSSAVGSQSAPTVAVVAGVRPSVATHVTDIE